MASSFRQKAALSNNVNQAPQASDRLTLSVPVNTAQREGRGERGGTERGGEGARVKSWGVGVGEKVSGEKEGFCGAGRERDAGGGGECFSQALPRIIRDGMGRYT